MRRSKFYNMRLPERGAREGEANDAADIEDLTYDLGIIDAEMERQRLEDVRLEKEKATKLELSQHKSAAVLDHPDNSVTDAKLGQRTVLTTSGTLQTLLTAIGNAIKAISGADTWNGTPATTLKDAKTHMGDAVKHITAQEREGWNAAATDRHSHTNKSVLDGITAAMVTAWNTVSSKLPLAGGTLTGFLTLHAAPATDMHAATKKYVDDKMAASGSGDMTKAVYDPGGRELPYIPKQDVDALAWGGDFGASGAPVSIAYAGAQRIASITAYGENAQGGTTEAPVALTGVDSVFVGGRNLLPKATLTETIQGITFTPNPDGSVRVSGTATQASYYTFAHNFEHALLGQTVCLSGSSQRVKVVINEETSNGTFVRNVLVDRGQDASGIVVKQKDSNAFYAVLQVQSGDTVNEVVYPMLNLGSTAMPYEPYQGSVTPLPIPRPLHKVGDVRDVCRTRVKSVWDKSVQVDITQLKKNSASPYQYYINVESNSVNIAVKPAASTLSYNLTTGIQPFKSGINFWMNGLLEVDDLEHAKAWFTEHPTKVFYQSTAYDGTNGLDVCLTEYMTGYIESYADESITTAWISSMGALSTGAEVAYVLSSPEVYATDPLDIDNAAGPLTVMTGGELEVRMTELIGSRSPELTAKMDKATYDADGDGVVDRAGSVDGGTY